MAVVTASLDAALPRPQPRRRGARPSEPPPGSRGSGSPSEIPAAAAAAEEESEMAAEKVHVAVGREVKDGKPTLLWALQHTPGDNKLVLLHVHQPATRISLMGAMVPISQLAPQEVGRQRQREKEEMNKALREYRNICSAARVQTELLVGENDDVAKGLIELIAQHRITKLVMGAAEDKLFLWGKKVKKSRTAIALEKQADKRCEILFVFRGDLINTRKAIASTEQSHNNMSSSSSHLEPFRSLSLPESSTTHSAMQDAFHQRSISVNISPIGGATMAAYLPPEWAHGAGTSSGSQRSSHPGSEISDEVLSNARSSSMQTNIESETRSMGSSSSFNVSEDDRRWFLSPAHHMEDIGIGNVIYTQLRQALTEAANLKNEVFEESRRRRNAERELLDASMKVKTVEHSLQKERNLIKDTEERLARRNIEVENYKKQHEHVLDELKKANSQRSALEEKITNLERAVKDFEAKLSNSHSLLEKHRQEYRELQCQRDDAVKEAEDLRQRKEDLASTSQGAVNFSEFTYSELKEATKNFDASLKIGQGGYGTVYRGFLRHTPVAIKMLNSESIHGVMEFNQEVDILSKVRHPNLVTLIGACREAWALVYELLPHGSLEDRLQCKDQSQPLSWQARVCIASEICSALIFLHSHKPKCIVHGDLKPDNILLDANYVSKLGDFGICRVLNQSNTTMTPYLRTDNPRGTFAYMDPDYLSSGELTSFYDVYSFGIVLLRLLTGKPPFGIRNEVQEALGKECLHEVLDGSAGEWPFEQAKQLAHRALRCCDLRRKKRPDLKDVWKLLESMVNMASSVRWSSSSSSFSSDLDVSHYIPSYFNCPLFKEIMRDPYIAADGFTYEAVAIKDWLDKGHDTSPVTGLKLAHLQLIPNQAIRSAIQEWLQKQQ